MLSAAKEKKEKKAIRHRGVGAPNKGMSRNRSRDSMGLICPGKTMLRSSPLQGSGAPTSVRTAGLPSMGFLATFGARRFPKGNRGKRVPSGHNCRRQLATGRPEQIQEPGTAVPGTPIFANNAQRGGPPLESPCRWLSLVLSFASKESTAPLGAAAPPSAPESARQSLIGERGAPKGFSLAL